MLDPSFISSCLISTTTLKRDLLHPFRGLAKRRRKAKKLAQGHTASSCRAGIWVQFSQSLGVLGTERKNRSQNSNWSLAENWEDPRETDRRLEKRTVTVTEECVLAVSKQCGLWICLPRARQVQVSGAGPDRGEDGWRTSSSPRGRWFQDSWESERLRKAKRLLGGAWDRGPDSSRMVGTLGSRGWLLPFGGTLSLSKSYICKSGLSHRGISNASATHQDLSWWLGWESLGKVSMCSKKHLQKAHFLCARQDLNGADQMVCQNSLIAGL